jgi:hypothetical protein
VEDILHTIREAASLARSVMMRDIIPHGQVGVSLCYSFLFEPFSPKFKLII